MQPFYSWLLTVRPSIIGSFIKKVLRIQRFPLETQKGIYYIDPISNFGSSLIKNGIYEPVMLKSIEDILKARDTFVDLGANEGYFSVIAGHLVGSEGRVIAIEPQTRLQSIINKNIELNKTSNIKLVKLIISESEGQGKIFLSPDINT